ncbi:MAG TPA: hypothetical protein DIT04_14150 [Dysgonomonas sp.]|nr:hypothetical protein [Dysgonomonas sp.]
MKNKLSFIISIIILFLGSCQNEEDFSNLSQPQEKSTFHFYGVKSVKDHIETRGVAQRNKLWSPGTTITVKLLNDPYGMAGFIKTWVSEWEEYANIKFEFVESGNAEVRIGFDWKNSKWVTWSYTGTDCKYIRNQNEATVNFAFWDTASEVERKADVLRVFGQVLGLELEHRHLSFDAGWTSRIEQYWEGEIEDIPWDELKEYVFDPIEERNLVQTDEYDANSIMIWPFDRRYASNTARDYNYELSEKDIEFIKYLYPGKEDNLAFTFVMNSRLPRPSSGWQNPTTFHCFFSLFNAGSFTVDFGDGVRKKYEGEDIISFSINMEQNDDNKTIRVYGNPKLIRGIDFPAAGIEYIDISACSELGESMFIEWIASKDSTPVSLDFSHNLKLENITIGYSMIDVHDLTEIKLPKSLRNLNLFDCGRLRHLDLSECRVLENISMRGHLAPAGFMQSEELAVEFANNLPVYFNNEEYGTIFLKRLEFPDFDPQWIRDICEVKGWRLNYQQ